MNMYLLFNISCVVWPSLIKMSEADNFTHAQLGFGRDNDQTLDKTGHSLRLPALEKRYKKTIHRALPLQPIRDGIAATEANH